MLSQMTLKQCGINIKGSHKRIMKQGRVQENKTLDSWWIIF